MKEFKAAEIEETRAMANTQFVLFAMKQSSYYNS
jgi:hypothetical protein